MAMMGLQDLMKWEYLCYLIQKCIKCEASELLLSLCYAHLSLWDRFSTIYLFGPFLGYSLTSYKSLRGPVSESVGSSLRIHLSLSPR